MASRLSGSDSGRRTFGASNWRRKDVARSSKESKRKLTIIHNYVVDMTEFFDRHPGGPEVLRDTVGKDGTMNFDAVGHSGKAKEWMKKLIVGKIHPDERR